MKQKYDIYGVDPNKPVTPEQVRDAIVDCFIHAHGSEMEKLKEFAGQMSEKEFEKMKELNIKELIRNFFEKTGGDYEKPTKASILKVLEELKEFAANFRNPEIIAKHYNEIMQLVNKL